MNFNEFFGRLALWVLKLRIPLLIVVVAISAVSVYLISTRIEVDNSFESYFIKDDPHKIAYDKFKQDFGEDTFVYVLYETDNAFSPKALAENYELTEELQDKVPYAKRVLSITSAEMVFGEDDELIVKTIGDNLPQTQAEADKWKRIVSKKEFYIGSLISRDFHYMAILMPCDFTELKTTKEINDAKDAMTKAVYSVINGPKFRHLHARAVGDPIFNSQYAKWTTSETKRMLIGTTIALIFLLFFVFRRFSGVVIPFSIVSLSVLWTFGLMVVIAKMRMTSTILPPLLAAVGICDSIHILSEFDVQFLRLKDRKRAIVETMKMLGYPCLLTSITTAAGFISLVVAPIRPLRETGILAAFGVVVAFILTVTLIVALLSFGGNRPKKAHMPEDFASYKLMLFVSKLTSRHPFWIAGVHLLVLIIGIVGMFLVNVDTFWLKNFGPDVKMRQDYEYVDEHMGTTGSLELIVDSGKENGAKEPALLKRMERLSEKLKHMKYVRKVIGLPNLLAEINRALHSDDDKYYRVPDTRTEVAQMLLLYENAGGGLVEDFIDFDGRQARITLFVSSLSDMKRKVLIDEIEALAKEELAPTGAKVILTSILRIAVVLTSYVVPSQIKSFLLAFFVITILLMIFFRSVKLGLIGMIPTTLPVLFTTGLMGFLGVNLDWVVTMVAAIGIGLSVDNTIHFFSRFRNEYNRVHDYEEASRLALTEVGRALLFNAFVLVIGFGISATSIMINVARFGQLSALLISLSLVITVLLSPVLIKWFKPFG